MVKNVGNNHYDACRKKIVGLYPMSGPVHRIFAGRSIGRGAVLYHQYYSEQDYCKCGYCDHLDCIRLWWFRNTSVQFLLYSNTCISTSMRYHIIADETAKEHQTQILNSITTDDPIVEFEFIDETGKRV